MIEIKPSTHIVLAKVEARGRRHEACRMRAGRRPRYAPGSWRKDAGNGVAE